MSLQKLLKDVNDRGFSFNVTNIDDPIDVYNNTLLTVASGNGFLDIVKDCIKLGAKVNNKNTKGDTPLYYALCQEWCDVGEVLLQSGANPNMMDMRGVISASGDEEIQLLVKYGLFILNPDIRDSLMCYGDTELKEFLVPKMAHRRWLIVRCASRFLSLQQRAVITANCPERKLARGEFENTD